MQTFTQETFERISEAAHDRARVSGATHRFYRYPARFSPAFVRACIEELTSPGDLVVDPFVGGGTTVVEAMLAGRHSLGSDINALATFVSRVKTTPLSEAEIKCLQDWFASHVQNIKLTGRAAKPAEWDESGYFRNVNCHTTWRHQRIIQRALETLELLPNERCVEFARCAMLRTAQLALDGKKTLPTMGQFRESLRRTWQEMIDAAREFGELHRIEGQHPTPIVVQQPASRIDELDFFKEHGLPKLVLTSPPYPGVHVLYHRWQVRGRRETPAPYWIANQLDGDGERYYTLGNRHERDLKGYFDNLEEAFSSIARLVKPGALIVHMVAFSKPEWQLPRYLEVMEQCGLCELSPMEACSVCESGADGRLWRDVPNRKWHASMQAQRAGSRELVLFHTAA